MAKETMSDLISAFVNRRSAIENLTQSLQLAQRQEIELLAKIESLIEDELKSSDGKVTLWGKVVPFSPEKFFVVLNGEQFQVEIDEETLNVSAEYFPPLVEFDE